MNEISPDGRWQWDGQQWLPVAAPRPTPLPRRKSHWPWFAGGGGALLLMSVCTMVAATSTAPRAPARAIGAGSTSVVVTPISTPVLPAAATAPVRDGSCAPQPCANDNYGWIVTINHVQYDAPGGSYSQAEPGNIFVLVDVTFTNGLDGEKHANPTEFVLQDGAGVKHTWRPFLDGPCASWQPVNVVKGGSFGPRCISFEATTGRPSGLVLHWTPSLGGGGYEIKLT